MSTSSEVTHGDAITMLMDAYVTLTRKEAKGILRECAWDITVAVEAAEAKLGGDDDFSTDEDFDDGDGDDAKYPEDEIAPLPRIESTSVTAPRMLSRKGSQITRTQTKKILALPASPDLAGLSAEEVLEEISEKAIQDRILKMAAIADHEGISALLAEWGVSRADASISIAVVRTVIAHFTEGKTGPFRMKKAPKKILRRKGGGGASTGGGSGSRRSSSAMEEFDDFPLHCPECTGSVPMQTRQFKAVKATEEDGEEKAEAAPAPALAFDPKKKTCAINGTIAFCPGLAKIGVEDTSVFYCAENPDHKMFCQDCGDRVRRLHHHVKMDAGSMTCTVKECGGSMSLTSKSDNAKCQICGEKQTKDKRYECINSDEHVCCLNPVCVYLYYQLGKYRACVTDWEARLKALLTMDSLYNIHFQPKKGDGTLLHVFAKRGNLKAVKMMCSQSGTSTPLNYDIVNRVGLTPLQVAEAQCSDCIFSNQHDLVSRRKITALADQYHRVYGMAGTLKHFLMKACEDSTNIKKESEEMAAGTLKPYDFILNLLKTAIYGMISSKKSFPDSLLVLVCDHMKQKESEDTLTRTQFWKDFFKPFLEELLHYENLHLDKTGWTWFSEVFMASPVWLEPSELPEGTRKGEEPPILYDDLVGIVDHQVKIQKDGLREQMRAMIDEDVEAWAAITRFEFLPTESHTYFESYRQDEMDLKITRDLAFSQDQLANITLVSKSGEYSAVTEFDSHSVMNNLIIMSHAVDHQFQASIEKIMQPQLKAKTTKFQSGPVKALQRCAAKAELEYKDRPFPKTCQIIDLVRCSLTYKTLKDCLEGMKILKEAIVNGDGDAVVDIMRVKNGFSKYRSDDPSGYGGDPPDTYRDVKFNVVVRGQGEFREFGIVGEVQFLLKPMLLTKQKNHELYEILRSAGLFQGAKQSVETFLRNKSETIAKDARAFAKNMVHNFYPLSATSTEVETWTVLHGQIEKYGGKSGALMEILEKMHKATIIAEINTADASKRTPLMLAIERRVSMPALEKLLVEPSKVEWTKKDGESRTYVHCLMEFLTDEEAIELVLDLMDPAALGKSMNSVDSKGSTPLAIALQKGRSLKICKKIIPDRSAIQWTTLVGGTDAAGKPVDKKTYLEVLCDEYGVAVDTDAAKREAFEDFLTFMGVEALGQILTSTNALLKMFVSKLPWSAISMVLDFMSSFQWNDVSRTALFSAEGLPLMHIVIENYGDADNFEDILKAFPQSILAQQINEIDGESGNTPLMRFLSTRSVSVDLLKAFCGTGGASAIDWTIKNKDNRFTLPLVASSCEKDGALFSSLLEFVGRDLIVSAINSSSLLVDMFLSSVDVSLISSLLDFVAAKEDSKAEDGAATVTWYEVGQREIDGSRLTHAIVEKYIDHERFFEMINSWVPDFVIGAQMNMLDSKTRTPLMIALTSESTKLSIEMLKVLVQDPSAADWSLCASEQRSYLQLFHAADLKAADLTAMFDYIGRSNVKAMITDGHGFLDLFRSGSEWSTIKAFMKYWGFSEMPWDEIEADRIDNLCLLHCICDKYRSQVLEILAELPNSVVFSQINATNNDKKTPLFFLLESETKISLEEIQLLLRQENAINWTFINDDSGYLSLLCKNVGADVELLSQLFDFIGESVVAYLFHHTIALTQMLLKGVAAKTLQHVLQYLTVDDIHWRRLQSEQKTLLHSVLTAYKGEELWKVLRTLPESLVAKQRDFRDANANTALQVACRSQVLTVELLKLLVDDFDKFDWTYRNVKDEKRRSYLAWIAFNCGSDGKLFQSLMDAVGRARVLDLFDPVETLIEMMNNGIDFPSIDLFVHYIGNDRFTLEEFESHGALFYVWMAENCKGDIAPLVDMARSDLGTVLSTDVLELMHAKYLKTKSFSSEEDSEADGAEKKADEKKDGDDESSKSAMVSVKDHEKYGAGKTGFDEMWRGTFDESGGWGHWGSRDAISFKASAPMMFMGSAAFCCSGETTCTLYLYKGENGGEGTIVGQSEEKKWKFTEKHKSVEPIMLKAPVFIEPDVKYTIEIDQRTDGNVFTVKDCQSSTKLGDLTITWMDAKASLNGTSSGYGAIPLFYFASPSFLLSAGEIKTMEMGGIGDTLKVTRGLFSPPTVFDWFHEGKKSALAVKVSRNCILEGIGVFCGEGETKVDVRVIKGSNRGSIKKDRVLGGTAKTKTFVTKAAPSQPASVFFDDPVCLQRGQLYTIEVNQTCPPGAPSYFVDSGCERITLDGFTLQLINADVCKDLTTVNRGSIPTFYFRHMKAGDLTSAASKAVVLKPAGADADGDGDVEIMRRSESKSSTWWYGGSYDAISVTSSEDFLLRGVGIWKGTGTTKVEVCIWLGDNGRDESNIVSRTGMLEFQSDSMSDEPEEAKLPTALQIEAGLKYTVEIRQTSNQCYYVTGGKSTTEHEDDIILTWSNASSSPNCTDSSRGAIPCLYRLLVDPSQIEAMRTIKRMGGIGSPILLERGDYTSKQQAYSGKRTALKFRVTEKCLFEGIGVLCGSGKVSIDITLLLGDNDENEECFKDRILTSERFLLEKMEKSRVPLPQRCAKPVLLDTEHDYTLEFRQVDNEKEFIYCVSNGAASIQCDGITVLFQPASYCQDSSATIAAGGVPALVLRRFDPFSVKAKQDGEISLVMRGTIDDGEGNVYASGDSRPDALAFKSDRSFMLTGIGVFPCAGTTEVKAWIFLGDNPEKGDVLKGRCVGSCSLKKFEQKERALAPSQLSLDKPLLIRAHQKYTIQLHQTNRSEDGGLSAIIEDGRRTVTQDGTVISFMDAKYSPNGTNVQDGAIPCIWGEFFTRSKATAVQLGAVGPAYIVPRGSVFEKQEKDKKLEKGWPCDGKVHALTIAATDRFVLQGVAVHVPVGESTVNITIYKGSNRRDEGLLSRVVARAKDTRFKQGRSEKLPKNVILDQPLLVRPGAKYTLEMSLSVAGDKEKKAFTWFVDNGIRRHDYKGFELAFSDADYSPGGTSASRGLMPGLYAFEYGGKLLLNDDLISQQLPVIAAYDAKSKMRGAKVDSTSDSKWAHAGDHDVLTISVTKRVVLRGVGVFCCAGESQAECLVSRKSQPWLTGMPFCRCGIVMKLMAARDPYGWSLSCDGCRTSCSGDAKVYHCPADRADVHSGGFDYCYACGQKATLGPAPKMNPKIIVGAAPMTTFTASSKSDTPQELRFAYPIVLEPAVEYKLDLHQKNSDGKTSAFIEDGLSGVDYDAEISGMIVNYSQGDGSDNGTSPSSGALPSLYLVDYADLLSKAERKVISIGGVGDMISSSRGDAVRDAAAASAFDGESALGIKSWVECIFEAVSVFCGKQGAGVDVSVFKLTADGTLGERVGGTSKRVEISVDVEDIAEDDSLLGAAHLVRFDEPVLCEERSSYVVKCTRTDPKDASAEWYVKTGKKMLIAEGLVFDVFSVKKESKNGTSSSQGSLPELHFRSTAKSFQLRETSDAGVPAFMIPRWGRVADTASCWNHGGAKDAIKVTNDGVDFHLRGMGTFLCTGSTTAKVEIYRDGKVVASSKEVTEDGTKSDKPKELRLTKPFFWKRGVSVDIVLTQRTSSVTCYVEDGKSELTAKGGIKLRVENSGMDVNCTNTSRGALPCFYICEKEDSKTADVTRTPYELTLLELGADLKKPQHVVLRGEVVSLEDAEKTWADEQEKEKSELSDDVDDAEMASAMDPFGGSASDDEDAPPKEVASESGSAEIDEELSRAKWTLDGSLDAIKFSVDAPCILEAVGIFFGRKLTMVRGRIIEGDNREGLREKDTKVVARFSQKRYIKDVKEIGTEPFPISLKAPIRLDADKDYTIELWQTNSEGSIGQYIRGGKPTVTAEKGPSFDFDDAVYSPNGTSLNEGVIPALYVRSVLEAGGSSQIFGFPLVSPPRGDGKLSDSRVWPCSGEKDAVCFTSDKMFLLRGIGVFPPDGKSTVSVVVYEGDNGEDDTLRGQVVASSRKEEFDLKEKAMEPVEVSFDKVFLVKAGVKYTIEVEQKNDDEGESACIVDCREVQKIAGGLTLEWSDAESSVNGTDKEEGTIACLFMAVLDEFTTKSFLLGAQGKLISLMRGGEVVAPAEESKCLAYDGKSVHALSAEFSKKLVLEGVGVLVGTKGDTIASARVIMGDNDSPKREVVVTAPKQTLKFDEGCSVEQPRMLRLAAPVLLDEDTKYTFEVTLQTDKGVRTCFVSKGPVQNSQSRTVCTLSDATSSPGGTKVSMGQIPCFFVRMLPSEEDYSFGGLVCKRGTVADETGRWNHNGSRDAIAFTLDKSLYLRGVGVLGCAGTTTVTVYLYKGNNGGGGELVGKSELITLTNTRKPLEAEEVKFEKPVKVDADVKYTVEIDQRNSGGVSGVTLGCSTTVSFDDYTCTFSSASTSPNGTGPTLGAIPTLYFVKSLLGGSAADRALAKLGADTEDIRLVRGPFARQMKKWLFSGKRSAVTLRCETTVILASVGVFVGEGRTTCRVQAYAGSLESTDGAIALGGSKMVTFTTNPEDKGGSCEYVGDSDEAVRLALDKPFVLRAGETYTIALTQNNAEGCSSRYVAGGYGHIMLHDVVLSIGSSLLSKDGTCVSEGAFAFFDFRKQSEDAAVSEDTKQQGPVICKCGAEMDRCSADHPYGSGIGCDVCGDGVSGSTPIYHCPRGAKEPHTGGYDYCMACADKHRKEAPATSDDGAPVKTSGGAPVIRADGAGPVSVPVSVSRGFVVDSEVWNHSGRMDAIAFEIEGEQSIMLTSIGVFAPEGECKVQYVKIFDGTNRDGTMIGGIASERTLRHKIRPKAPIDVTLDAPVRIAPGKIYTVELLQINSLGNSGSTERGRSDWMKLAQGFRIKFSEAAVSENGTDTADGAIPTLTFDARVTMAQKMGATGDALSFWNGVPTISERAEASVTKDDLTSRKGDSECISFISDTALVIESFSTFVAKGENFFEVFAFRKDDGKPKSAAKFSYKHESENPSIAYIELPIPLVLEKGAYCIEVKQSSASPVPFARDGFARCSANGAVLTFDSVHKKSMIAALIGYNIKDREGKFAIGSAEDEQESLICADCRVADVDLGSLEALIGEMDAIPIMRGSKIEDSSGIWNHGGSKDAIEFTTNKAFILRGAGVLCCAGTTTSTIRIYEGRNDSGTVIGHSEMQTYTHAAKQMEPVELRLIKPVFIESGKTYTYEVEQRNSGSVSAVVKGDSPYQSTHDDLTIQWAAAAQSPNSTGTARGSCASLYIIRQVITSQRSQAMLRMGGDKDIFEIIRGEISECSKDEWNHDGKIDAVEVSVDTNCILDKVGVFVGKGNTRVHIRAFASSTRADSLPKWSPAVEVFAFEALPTLTVVPLPMPVGLMPGMPVTVQVEQSNEGSSSWYVAKGAPSVTRAGITYTFADSKTCESKTTAASGGVPAIYTRPLRKGEELENIGGISQKEVEKMAHFIKLFKPSVVTRGEISFETGRWTHYGPQDAINFKCDTACVLRGIGVFPSKEAPTSLEAKVYELDKAKTIKDGVEVAEIEEWKHDSPYLGGEPIEVQFASPLFVKAHMLYTIVLSQKNEMGPSRFIKDGKSTHKVEFSEGGHMEVRFLQSKDSFNSTDIDEGAIPTLYFTSLSSLLSDWGKKAAKLGCSSERHVFKRGKIVEQPRRKWKCEGGVDTLAMKVDKSCIFEGVGLLPGKGRTTARLRVKLAEKDVLSLQILKQDEEDTVGDFGGMMLGRARRQTHARRASVSHMSGRLSLTGKGIEKAAAVVAEMKRASIVGKSLSLLDEDEDKEKEEVVEPEEVMITVGEAYAAFDETEKIEEARVLRLDAPILLEEGYTYTLELEQANEKNELSAFVRECERKVTEAGISVEFVDPKVKKGRSTLREGQFAEVYLRSRMLASEALAQAMLFTEAMQMWRGETRDETGRWNCNGSVDAIAFKANQDMMLRGVGIYCVAGTTNLDYVKVFEGDNSSGDANLIASASGLEWKFAVKQKEPVEAQLETPVLIKADQKYTVEIVQRNGSSLVSCFCKGKGYGTYTTEHDHGYTLTWLDAARSSNGTDCDEGAIPCLYALNPFAEMSEEDRKVFELGGDGLPIAITRGAFTSTKDWTFDGTKKSAIQVRPDKQCVFEGVGAFVGAKGASAKLRVFQGIGTDADGKHPLSQTDAIDMAAPKDCAVPQVLRLTEPILLDAGEVYTIELSMKNNAKQKSFSVKYGQSIVYEEGVTLEFSTSIGSTDGTDVTKGAIGRVYLRKMKDDGSEVKSDGGDVFWSTFDVGAYSDKIDGSTDIRELLRGRISDESGVWNHGGANDCISFESTHAFVLRGIGIFACAGTTTASAKIFKNESEQVASAAEKTWTFGSKQSKPFEFKLDTPLIVEEGVKYKIQLSQRNSGGVSCVIRDGKASMKVKLDDKEELKITFSSAAGSNNGTDVEEGAIPTLYILTQAELIPEWRRELNKKLNRLSAGGPSVCIERGRFYKEKDKWLLNNYLTALKFKVDTECALEGIGVLAGKGKTRVEGRLWQGDNDKTLRWGDAEDSRLVGVIEEQFFVHLQRSAAPDCAYLRDPILLEPGKWYTIELKQLNEHGEPSFFVKNGQSQVTEGGLTVNYDTAKHVCDGTSVTKGAVPGIYIRKIVGSEKATEAEYQTKRGEFKCGDMRWAHRGDGRKDALCVSVDKDVELFGVGAFLGAGNTRVTVSVFEGDNDDSGKLLSSSGEKVFFREIANEVPIEVPLLEKVKLEKGVRYTIEVVQLNSPGQYSWFIESGEREVTSNAVTFTFSNAKESSNGTSLSQGAVPILFWDSEDAREEMKRRAVVWRGTGVDKSGVWNHGGGVCDAIAIEVSKPITLLGIGVFGCDGHTIVKHVKIFEGSNRDGKMIGGVTAERKFESKKSLDPIEYLFDSPVSLKPATQYTIELLQKNEGGLSCLIEGGESETGGPLGVTVSWSTAAKSDNGTSVGRGAIPCLYMAAPDAIQSRSKFAGDTAPAISNPNDLLEAGLFDHGEFAVFRGHISKTPDWGHDTKVDVDALDFRVTSHDVILHGIGVFVPPTGRAKVRVDLLDGSGKKLARSKELILKADDKKRVTDAAFPVRFDFKAACELEKGKWYTIALNQFNFDEAPSHSIEPGMAGVIKRGVSVEFRNNEALSTNSTEVEVGAIPCLYLSKKGATFAPFSAAHSSLLELDSKKLKLTRRAGDDEKFAMASFGDDRFAPDSGVTASLTFKLEKLSGAAALVLLSDDVKYDEPSAERPGGWPVCAETTALWWSSGHLMRWDKPELGTYKTFAGFKEEDTLTITVNMAPGVNEVSVLSTGSSDVVKVEGITFAFKVGVVLGKSDCVIACETQIWSA